MFLLVSSDLAVRASFMIGVDRVDLVLATISDSSNVSTVSLDHVVDVGVVVHRHCVDIRSDLVLDGLVLAIESVHDLVKRIVHNRALRGEEFSDHSRGLDLK